MATFKDEAAMSDYVHTHERHHDYTYRLPTPPRIVVPPPTLSSEYPKLHFSGRGACEEDLDLSFLKELDLKDIVEKNTLNEWSYENRRNAHMVLPWLYLGPLTAGKDRDFLAREGITMVLAIRTIANSMSGALRIAKEVCLEVASIDAPNYLQLTRKLSETASIINKHLAMVRKHSESTGNPQLGKVLVFCESGNEKSAAVVAAYLMETLDDFDYVKSMQVCQAQRFCVNFDDTIKHCLQSYWDVLLARRSVSNARSAVMENAKLQLSGGGLAPGSLSNSSKRSIDDTMDEDDDVDMTGSTDPTDVLRFAGRDMTPFE
jgi:serine/threonine/tyrosine-interacting protein